MKYSINAQRLDGDDVSAGHLTAASALAGWGELKVQGASQIQVIDTKTGRLIDEVALRRADDLARHLARLRPAV